MLFLSGADWINVAQIAALFIQSVFQGIQMGVIVNLMTKITDGPWLLEQARKYGIMFDKILIKYANAIYNYFVQIIDGTLFTPEVIDGIMTRLYIIVGVFIFFKLAALAIKYIVSPEQFLDAKVGGETLIKRILIGCVTIIAMPLIFDIAMGIQSAIIKDNVIAKILLPKEIYHNFQAHRDESGKYIGMIIFQGFFSWNETVPGDAASDAKNNYDMVIKYNDIELFNEGNINKEVGDIFVFSYVPIISTLAIGYFLVTLLRYAMEVLVRSIKLAFLQIIAPFSIIKWMLDPSDNDSLKKWLNTTISTYLIIFLRVFSLFFISMMAYYLKNGIPTSNGGVQSLITSDADAGLKALIALALFAFLKELPKLISDLFGYNLQENEAIGSIINTGVGVAKGFALGKVGMEVQKPMMGLGIASSAAGAAGGAIQSGISGFQKGGVKGALSGSFGGVSGGLGQINSLMGGAISSNFGNSALAPLTRGTGSIVQGSSYGSGVDKNKENNENNINVNQQDSNTLNYSTVAKAIVEEYKSKGVSNIDEKQVEKIIQDLKVDPQNITSEHRAQIDREIYKMSASSTGANDASRTVMGTPSSQNNSSNTTVNFDSHNHFNSSSSTGETSSPSQNITHDHTVEVGSPGPTVDVGRSESQYSPPPTPEPVNSVTPPFDTTVTRNPVESTEQLNPKVASNDNSGKSDA